MRSVSDAGAEDSAGGASARETVIPAVPALPEDGRQTASETTQTPQRSAEAATKRTDQSIEAPAGGLISVLIGVYNGASYLRESIESVLAQTYRPLELILVDDGSSDSSAAIARSYGERVRYVYQENAGDGAARNTAVKMAQGAMFAFMDADDRSSADRLERQQAALAGDPSLDAVFAHVREFISPELTEAQRAGLKQPSPEPMPYVAPTVMLIWREAFARVGPFSESLRLGSTVDWCARAIDLGLRTGMLPEVLMERRLHTANLGLRRQDARHQYLDVVKATLQRRRALGLENANPTLPEEGGEQAR